MTRLVRVMFGRFDHGHGGFLASSPRPGNNAAMKLIHHRAHAGVTGFEVVLL